MGSDPDEATGSGGFSFDGRAGSRFRSERAWGPLTGRKRWLARLGGLILLAGLVAPVVLGRANISPAYVSLGGILALLVGLSMAALLGRGERSVRRPPPVENRDGVRRAGAPFEASVRASGSDRTGTRIRGRAAVRDRLKPLAEAIVADETDEDAETARSTLERGTWTDDRVAASLFWTTEDAEADDRSLTGRFRGPPKYATRVSHAVDELADLALGDAGERAWLSDPDPDRVTRNWTTGAGRTGRWHGFGALGLLTLAVAVFAQQSALVLVAATLLGLAGYARLFDPPAATLSVDRSFDPADPGPGEAVTVTVTVTNEDDRLLADLRVVDDVPAHLTVVDGSPRHATALRPGESTTYSYDVLAVYGDHRFDAMHAAVRDASGQRERTATESTATATLSCEPRTVQESVPLHPQATGVVGRVPSDVGGSGHEFHSVREYRRGDPLGRIDWNRMARTGDLATLEFHEEHAATVVLLVDSRLPAFRAPDRDAVSAVQRSLAGAAQVFATLQRDGDRVGLASVGPEPAWVGPGAGADHRSSVRSTLRDDPAFAPREWDATFSVARYVRRLRRRLPSDAQLILFSPLLDDPVLSVTRRLHAHGHRVTVFSPDPTRLDTIGGTVTHLERRQHLADLRAAGVRVVDWAADESLVTAVDRARRGWRA